MLQAKEKEKWAIKPVVLFGIQKFKDYAIDFLEDHQVVHVLAGHICVFDLNSKRKKFIKLEFESRINMVYFCIKKRLVVIEEFHKSNGFCLRFFNLDTGRKLNYFKDNVMSSIIDLKFSADATRMLTQCGHKDWTLSIWSFENKKLMCKINVIDCNLQPKHTVTEISFYPTDKNKILVIGMCTLVTYQISNKNFHLEWKMTLCGNLLTHTWLNPTDVLIGDDAGRILLFDIFNKNLRQIGQHVLSDDASSTSAQTNDVNEFCKQLNELKINKLIRFKTRFLCLIENKLISIYDKNLSGEYVIIHSIKIPLDNTGFKSNDRIETISINQQETLLICVTSTSRIFKLELADETAHKAFELNMVESFHSKDILYMDVCQSKPLVVTCAKDNWVKIWNYNTHSIDYCKEFDQDVYSVAIHPNGLYLAVACFEKIIYNGLFFDHFKPIVALSINECKHCAFSHGGQYFAAIDSNCVSIYCTLTYKEINNLNLANGKIKHFAWCASDYQMFTCSNTGIVSLWDVEVGVRLDDYVVSTTTGFDYLATGSSGKLDTKVFVIDNKTTIRTLCVSTNNNNKSCQSKVSTRNQDLFCDSLIKIESGKILTMCCDTSGDRLLLALNDGTVSLMCSSNLEDAQKILSHSTAISKAKLFNQHLAMCSTDGLITIWSIDASTSASKVPIKYSDEVLVARNDANDWHADFMILSGQLSDQYNKNVNDVRVKQIDQAERLKTAELNNNISLNEIKELAMTIQIDNDSGVQSFNDRIEKLKTGFEVNLTRLREVFENQLVEKFRAYDCLCKDFEEQLEAGHGVETIDRRHSSIDDMEFVQNQTLNELIAKQEEELNTIKHELKLVKAEIEQIEDDGDREVQQLQSDYESRLGAMLAANEKYKRNNSLLLKQIAQNEQQLKELEENESVFSGFLTNKDKRVKEISTRLGNLMCNSKSKTNDLGDRDQKAFELKLNNQHLEKLRFINEHKIKILQNTIEPLKNENASLMSTLEELQTRSTNTTEYYKKLKCQEQNLRVHNDEQANQLRTCKLRYTKGEKLCNYLLAKIADLAHSTRSDEQKALLKQVSNKLCEIEDIDVNEEIDQNVLNEVQNQHRILKRRIQAQQRLICTNEKLHRKQIQPFVQMNSTLARKVVELDNEIQVCLTKLQDAQQILGMKKSNARRLTNLLMSTMESIGQHRHVAFDKSCQQASLIGLQLETIKQMEFECKTIAAGLSSYINNINNNQLRALVKKYRNI